MHRATNRETMSTVAPAAVRSLTLPGEFLVNLEPRGVASEVERLLFYAAFARAMDELRFGKG